ncbi:hypothetical protein CLV84_1152 [Neolewinella xylanilytica]|uniref:Lipoprotein n=1 Tax=Neolewinella xylanilytica TaxID=1514080 RepID=A0A2S6I9K6_9BACT|nr:hypothetical protein [Neolewinella xylanilytica]PPK88187.1 hypothetical protein CLV84_1152 [Neolewinella xylanilytica]
MRRLPSTLPLLIALTGCSQLADDELQFRPECGQPIQIVDALVELQTDDYTLLELTVEDRCLTVRIAATGCSGDQFGMDLLTRGQIAESTPTQTSARLIFDDNVTSGDVTCQAEFERQFSFDLLPYLNDGALPTRFSLIGLDTTLSIE